MRGLFEQGRLGMFTVGNWALTDVQAGAQMPWGVAPLPAGQGGPGHARQRRHLRRLQGRQAARRRLGAAGRPGDGRRGAGDGHRVEHAALAEVDDPPGGSPALQAGVAAGDPAGRSAAPASPTTTTPATSRSTRSSPISWPPCGAASARPRRHRRDRAAGHPAAELTRRAPTTGAAAPRPSRGRRRGAPGAGAARGCGGGAGLARARAAGIGAILGAGEGSSRAGSGSAR